MVCSALARSRDSDADRCAEGKLRDRQRVVRYVNAAIWFMIGALALAAFPFVANDYWLYMACLVSIHIISTTGLNILTGYTGLVSLGQAAFMGVGAYTARLSPASRRLAFPRQPAGRGLGHSVRWHRVRVAEPARERALSRDRDDRGFGHPAFRVPALDQCDRRQYGLKHHSGDLFGSSSRGPPSFIGSSLPSLA